MTVICMLFLLLPFAQESRDHPSTIAREGIFLESTELSSKDAEAYLENLILARRVLSRGIGLELPFNIKVRVRVRPDSQRFYWTDGQETLTVQYINAGQVLPVLPYDGRIMDIAIPAYLQMYLMRSATRTAGLDRRILESFSEFLRHLAQLANPDVKEATPCEGLGQVWEQIDNLYGDGTTSFLLNSLNSIRVPGHQLGESLRDLAESSTEDPKVATFLDLICPSMPLYGAMDLEPGKPLAPNTNIRLSNGCLFNGVRLMDQEGPKIEEAMRLADFEKIFSNVIRTYPDRSTASFPPRTRGVDLWRLYFEFRPRIQRAADNLDYYLVLREFFSRLADHTLTVLSMHGAAYWRGVTGLSCQASGNRVFVDSVTESSEAATAGVRTGMELIEIDGRPTQMVWNALEVFLKETFSCSSQAMARARALNVLLTGAEESKARLKLTDGSDTIGVELTRGAPSTMNVVPVLAELMMRDDGIAVIKVRSFFVPEVVKQFMKALEDATAKSAKGIILDLRENEGGDPKLAFTILNRLLLDRVSVATIVSRDEAEKPGAVITRPIVVGIPKEEIKDPRMKPYAGPLAVVVDAWTGGCSELLAIAVQLSGRGQVFGAPTSGYFNQAIQPLLPWQTLPASGVTVSFAHYVITRLDGEPLEAQSVVPDVEVGWTPEDWKNGRDPVVEAAATRLLQ